MSRYSIKDARYRLLIETGTVTKDWGGRLPVALIYPNSYYVGMSNLGIHVIYSLLNGYRNVVCERVFLEDSSKVSPATPLSLESQRPLPDFAVLAFSVTYELDFFNVARVLKASGIPLYAADRDDTNPLVIAGGPCITANPMPLSPFFDCLCIGEAEAILPGMLPVLEEDSGGKRDELLKKLGKLPGIYIPRLNSNTPAVRQWVKNLDDYPAHSTILTPDTELGNLYLIEVQRGCNRGCRFCLVSSTFSPARFRSLDILLEQAREGLKHRKRIGLVGPAVSDHPQFEELLAGLHHMGAEIAVSSLRVKPLPDTALSEITKGKTKTIALAPEAGSQRLRDVIRKGISEDDVIESMYKVAAREIKQLKLYFMIGLPTETDNDIEEMADLILRCKAVLDKEQPGCRITLSVAPFVPKAGTPFQWLAMEELSVLNRRVSLLKKRLSPEGIKIRAESPAWSRVQGVLARGDTKLAGVLAEMDDVSLSGWQKAMEKCGLDINLYLDRKPGTSAELPWSFIDPGIEPDYLKLEFDKAFYT